MPYKCCECKKELPIIEEINDCHDCGRVVCEDCLYDHKYFYSEIILEEIQNNKSLEERKNHLKKALETTKKINSNENN